MSELDSEQDVKDLQVESIIGFDGGSVNSFIVHPDKQHIIYALGNKVAIQNWNTKKQTFLEGHTNIISTVAVSTSGKYIASGQINHIGFKACIIVWDFEKKHIISQYEPHNVRVECVTFSRADSYVISLGGRDCNSVVIWDIKEAHVVCVSKVAKGVQGNACVVLRMNRREACFVTGGDCHLTVWTIHHDARNFSSVDVTMSKLKRNVYCIDTNERDEFCFCGTSTGDVLKVRMFFHHDIDVLEPTKQPQLVGCYARLTRKKLPRGCVDLYHKGVRAIKVLFSGELLIGAGDGTLELVEECISKAYIPQDPSIKLPSVPGLKVLRSTDLNDTVTSIQLLNQDTILAATTSSEIYIVNMQYFQAKLVITCHTSIIHDIAFPYDFSEVFATAGKQDVRIWSLSTIQELLRIQVPNFTCSSVIFTYDGKSILTGWNDGTIRSFTPLTGRPIYVILNAHNKGVTAISIASHGRFIVSGGCEGQVRLWEVSPARQTLACTLKEHKGPVSSIDINKFDTEAVSASSDGSCIIWDLKRQRRRQILFAKTMFKSVKYFPTGVQVLTAGSDRKIGYWEVLDGTLVRELEGSTSRTVNTLDISPDGELLASGSDDQFVKIWNYQEGITTHIGLGHAAVITCICFSPDGKNIVSCDASGCVFVWKVPTVQEMQQESETHKKPNRESSNVIRDKQVEDIKDLPTSRSAQDGQGDSTSTKNECINHENLDQRSCCKCNPYIEALISPHSSCSSPKSTSSVKTHSSRSPKSSQKSCGSGNSTVRDNGPTKSSSRATITSKCKCACHCESKCSPKSTSSQSRKGYTGP